MKSIEQQYKKNHLFFENVSVRAVAHRVGTPFYLYSQATIEKAYQSYNTAFKNIPHLICYALKANGNLAIGRILSRLGAGVDIVSGGELQRALKSGFPPSRIIFSGVGKSKQELKLAIQKGVRLINVESGEELHALSQIATSLRKIVPFSLRVNPDVSAGGHPHISTGTPKNKFGVHHRSIFPLYAWAARQKYLRAEGIQSHIGSQITNVAPYRRALTVLMDLVRNLRSIGVHPSIIDLGGGLGVDYNGEHAPMPEDLSKIVLPILQGTNLTLFLEPGRSLVAQSGALITKVLYRKDGGHKHFVVVDAAMNDLARPALYDAYHEIIPVEKKPSRRVNTDVVGPICESGDYLARSRQLVLPQQGDLLAVLTAGAYGFSMSSQYNARPRIAEVLVSKNRYDIIRQRETVQDLIRGETIPRRLR